MSLEDEQSEINDNQLSWVIQMIPVKNKSRQCELIKSDLFQEEYFSCAVWNAGTVSVKLIYMTTQPKYNTSNPDS